MAFSNHFFYGILILQIYVQAAPNNVSKFEDIVKIEELVDKDATASIKAESGTDSTDSSRQKRYFNPYGYGFPPISSLLYPNFKRDVDFPVPSFGVDEPLLQIHKRVQEIANVVRRPEIPPHNPHSPNVPIFYPVFFIPPFECNCNTQIPQTTESQPTNSNQPAPNVTNRFPEMEDERQNWGFVINNTDEADEDDGQDFSRPISFDPIRSNRPNARPPPPVDHGSSQSDIVNNNRQQSGGNSTPRPPQNSPPSGSGSRNQDSTFFNSLRPPSQLPQDEVGQAPTRCDGAILTCCHQPQVLYDCFAIQGCPNFTSYGNPCNTNAILSVIEKFQKYYGARSG